MYSKGLFVFNLAWVVCPLAMQHLSHSYISLIFHKHEMQCIVLTGNNYI